MLSLIHICSRKGESSSILRKSSRERVSRILQADSSARSLVLSLYGTREKFRRPDVTIYDLKVSYTPETAEAVDSLYTVSYTHLSVP